MAVAVSSIPAMLPVVRHGCILPAAWYAILMALLNAVTPLSPYLSALPEDLLEGFRAMSVLAVSGYWLFPDLLRNRLRPGRGRLAPLKAAPAGAPGECGDPA